MPLSRLASAAVFPLALTWSQTAKAHAFAQPWVLPMPYWMYIWGAVAALVLSFFVIGVFVRQQPASDKDHEHYFGDNVWINWLRRLKVIAILRLFAVSLLLLCIVTGLFGSSDPYRNFNMTFFWLVFGLGFSYLTALIGNVYSVLNPWRVTTDWAGRIFPALISGRFRYPQKLGYWPAVLLYMLFIWLELFANIRPFGLSIMLLGYSGISLLGVYLIGSRDWFRYCDFLAVFLRLIAMMAPIEYAPEKPTQQRLRLRWPFAGLLEAKAEHFSLLVFVLFMLSSTAFDGLRETAVWFGHFWKDPTGLIEQMIGEHPIYAYPWLRPWFIGYETIWMILLPFLYLAVFTAFLYWGKRWASSQLGMASILRHFTLTLLPIAVVYHITHYYTLLLSQGSKIRALISDPFGWNWDLFGTAYSMRIPILPNLTVVWYTQVALILLGHIASVYLAHRVALQVFPNHRKALLSQIPVLMLMVLFTGFGLWILAQPLQSVR